MKKKLLLMLTLCLLAQWSVAQAPKWVDKAKRAVFSVVTYDQMCIRDRINRSFCRVLRENKHEESQNTHSPQIAQIKTAKNS